MPRGVTGNTSDFGSEESRFEPWRGNCERVGQCKGIPEGPSRRAALRPLRGDAERHSGSTVIRLTIRGRSRTCAAGGSRGVALPNHFLCWSAGVVLDGLAHARVLEQRCWATALLAVVHYLTLMKTLRIYVDTSVLGGCFDEEFAVWSNRLMRDFRQGRYIAIVSDLLSVEVARAPNKVRQIYADLLTEGAEELAVSTEALDLLAAYENHSVLGPRYRADMLHIALATVANADVLVSWNFRHIVRFDKIRLFNAVNLEQGYKHLAIHSPREVSTDDDGRDSSGRDGPEYP
jgi:hypothetical protein